MDEATHSNTVFIDVAMEAEQYPVISEVVSAVKDEPNSQTTSASLLETYLSPQPNRLRCVECKRFTCETEEQMLRHIRKNHRGENPFQCYMCDYSTYNKVLFEEHVNIHQGIKPYKCAHCPYRSASKKNTKKHENIHRPDNPHKCSKCGFIARHAKSLIHHESTHGPVTHECDICAVSFHSDTSFTNHRKSRRRCPECKKMFCQKIYNKHRLEAHGVVKKKKTCIKKALFICAICKWEGNTKLRVLLHLIHHPNQEVDESVVDTRILRELGIMGQSVVIE